MATWVVRRPKTVRSAAIVAKLGVDALLQQQNTVETLQHVKERGVAYLVTALAWFQGLSSFPMVLRLTEEVNEEIEDQ